MHNNIRNILIMGLTTFLITGLSCGQKNRLSTASQITIYFVDWDLLTYTQMSCNDLKTFQTSVQISLPKHVSEFVRLLEEANLEELPDYDSLDARICCQIEDHEGNILEEISFCPTSLMQVGDKVYTTYAPLLEFMVGFLPTDYIDT